MSAGSSHRLRSPQIVISRDPIPRTPACASRGHPPKAKQDEDVGSEDLFGSDETNKAPTPKKTPGSPSRFLQQSARRPSPSPYVGSVKAVVAKQDEIRKALSPGRLGAPVTRPTTPHQSSVKMTRKSELVRKMEGKVRAVISNRDEIMRERSERAKREREERMQRVQCNNRKKEEEQAARLAIIRKREQEIEELRKQNASPSKGRTRMMSTIKTPPRSASRPHGWTAGETLSRCSPQKRTRNTPDKDAFVNEMVPRTPESPSVAEASSRWKNACDTLEFPKTYKPMRSEIMLPEVEVSMSNACGAEDDCVASSNDVLTELHAETLLESKEQVDDGEDQDDRVVEKTKTSVVQVDLVETVAGHEMDEQQEIMLGEEDGGEEQPKREETGEENAEIDEEEQIKEARRETGEGEAEVQTNKENIDVSNYEVTPEKKPLPSTEDNYNIEDLSSGDETDDEDQPRKAIPLWARPENLRRVLREQRMHPPIDVDAFFGPVVVPDLKGLFPSSKTRYRQRTSSANWSSPLSNPTKGTSKYFSSQRGER
ncbi:unnamed protein product [Toxocara canis]|uniref:INCENP_ARK-bind domain-containing protein n=1 Tax=Toxocara canis TaxID=6265 RepID=A0A183V7S1_TOXCA|nr:unnamed protein product [Toxocara canis]